MSSAGTIITRREKNRISELTEPELRGLQCIYQFLYQHVHAEEQQARIYLHHLSQSVIT